MSRILAVDDSPVIHNLVKMTIETDQSLMVDTAHDAEEAFQHCRNNQYDLLILDYMMPGMTGIELIKKLRQHQLQNDVPIFMLTAEGGSDIKAQAREQKVTAWITKPFQPQTLINMVQKILSR